MPAKSTLSRTTRVCCGSSTPPAMDWPPGTAVHGGSRCIRSRTASRRPQQLSGVAGIHEDADGNLWLATYGSGLVRIDPNRRSAVRYRHSPLDPDGISDDMLDVGVRGPRGQHLGRRGDGRTEPVSTKTAAFQPLSTRARTIRRAFCERPSAACMRTARTTSGWAAPWA